MASLQVHVCPKRSVGGSAYFLIKRQGENCKSTPFYPLRRGAESVNKPFVLSWLPDNRLAAPPIPPTPTQ